MSLLRRGCPVKYACTCGQLKPISQLHFCRHCSAIRCGFCVSHEVDARYCPNCQENLPVAEAWMKNNCCTSCINCPVCGLNLTTRATSIRNKQGGEGASKEDAKSEPKKLYYLCCFGCQWTSRDVGIPDQTTASAAWPEFENPNSSRVNELIEYYKAVALNDKILNEKKQPFTRRSYSHISGMSAAAVRRKIGYPLYSGAQYPLPGFQEVKKLPEIQCSSPLENFNDLPKEVFTKTPDLISMTTLEQRLGTAALQCSKTSELKPFKKLLLLKRSKRCRECEHNVTKPEFNPSSIKFKILLSAYYHIPNISIRNCESLYPGQSSDLFIHLVNPTPHQVTVKFLSFNAELKNQCFSQGSNKENIPKEENADEKQNKNKKPPLKIDYLMKVDPRPINVILTGTVALPDSYIILPRRDDAAEYDDTSENDNFNDDKTVVIWRKGNQATIKLQIIPNENLEPNSDVLVGFIVSHTYINTIIQDKTQQEINHSVKVTLNCGKTMS